MKILDKIALNAFVITYLLTPILGLIILIYGSYIGITADTFLDRLEYEGTLIYSIVLPVFTTFGFTLVLWIDHVFPRQRVTYYTWYAIYALHLLGYALIGFYLGHAYRSLSGSQAITIPLLGFVSLIICMYNTYKNLNERRLYAHHTGDAPVAQPQQSSVARASENITENAPAATVYPFNFTQPSHGLQYLAGMADLKQEIYSAIRPFTEYKGRKCPVSDRNGILLSGPPGNGKTTFAEAIAAELGMRFVKVSLSDVTSQWVNESPKVLRSLFTQAATEPTVVFFDEFDAIASSRGGDSHSEDKKVVNALLPELDNARKKHILIIAATNYPENIDAAIARDGRFDFRIEIPYPDREARAAILTGMLEKFKVRAEKPVIDKVAELWERRSIAFIEGVAKRLRDDGRGGRGKPVTVEQFKEASRAASRRPSAIPKEGAKLSELALPESVRVEANSLIFRMQQWEAIAEQGGEVPSGVLLYGPPGTGKTAFVRSLARELECWHVFEVSASEVLQKPRKFRDVVEMAADHRPAIVFIDEADELLRARNGSFSDSATNEILKTMDGMMGRVPEVVFIAATNNPEAIDAAAVRGGRFAEKILMPRLSGDDLRNFLAKQFQQRANVSYAPDVNPDSLAAYFGTIAPADCITVLRKAVNYTLGSTPRPVTFNDIEQARSAIEI